MAVVKPQDWHEGLIREQRLRNQAAIRALKILSPLWLSAFIAMSFASWHRGDNASATGVLILGAVLFSIMSISTGVWCILRLRQARRASPPATAPDGGIQISWNDNLVTEQIRLNNRLTNWAKIIVPIWLIAILGDAAFYWRTGDMANAGAIIIVGLVSLLIIVLMTTAWCLLTLRQMRSIPPVTVTDSTVQIGSVIIQRTDIVRVEVGDRGSKRRRLAIYLRDGSSRRLNVPQSVPVTAVKELLKTG